MNLRYTLNVVAAAFILHTFHACATPLPLINTINTRNLVVPSADSGANLHTSREMNALESIDSSPLNLSIRSDSDSDSEFLPDKIPIVETTPFGGPVKTLLRQQFNNLVHELGECATKIKNDFAELLQEFCVAMERHKLSPELDKAKAEASKAGSSTLPSKSSSLSSTSSSGSTAQTSRMKCSPEAMETAMEMFQACLEEARGTKSLETSSNSQLEPEKKSITKVKEVQSATKKSQDTIIAILKLWERIIWEETVNLKVRDQGYTKKDEGGDRSYRDQMVLPGIDYAEWAHTAKHQVSPQVIQAAGIFLANMKAIDDKIMGKEHTTSGK
ncbi:hypothetical protein H0H93_009243 [Arthromyces matolae]|nr:hypothetical protein H0H93_009243 [Arthromyces matolae]